MLDESLVGRVGAPFTMVIELGKIREFARAVRASDRADDGAPGDRVLTPATFLMAAAWWQRPQNNPLHGIGLDLRRILHGGQEFNFHGEPPRAGDVLTGQTRVEKVFTKAGSRGGTMTFLVQRTDFVDDHGRLVADVGSTMIETSKSTGAG
jgi:hypothetical protein